jgi:2,3-bisphosphoglycerate-dependent phosphoglycerate mutase
VSTTLLLARHGETEWNRLHRWQGFTGPPLNGVGREQACALAESLHDIDAIYSSDSVRARETAQPAAQRLRLSVVEDSRLREVNFGLWEGLTSSEINQRYAGASDRWDSCEPIEPPPEGETDLQMAERVVAAVSEIASNHPCQRVLVVTSGGPIRAVQAHALGLDQSTARRRLIRVDNCALVELVITNAEFVLQQV